VCNSVLKSLCQGADVDPGLACRRLQRFPEDIDIVKAVNRDRGSVNSRSLRLRRFEAKLIESSMTKWNRNRLVVSDPADQREDNRAQAIEGPGYRGIQRFPD